MPAAPQEKHVEYYVLKHGEMFGPVFEKDLRAGLANGEFVLTDFIQVEGQPIWQPLGRVLDTSTDEIKGALAPEWASILKWAWLRLRYNLDEQSVAAGGICLAVGTISLALAHWPFVFWIPWFFAAAVAGVALIRRKHEGHGALLLAGVIAVPMLFLIFEPKRPAEKSEIMAAGTPGDGRTASLPTPAPPPTPKPFVSTGPAATPVPTPINFTPVPPEAVARPPLPHTTPAPSPSAPPVHSLAAVSTPIPAPLPASSAPVTPVPESFLSTANKIAGAVVPFFTGSKPAPPSGATPSPSSWPSLPSLPSIPFLTPDETSPPWIDAIQGHSDAFVIIKGSNGSGSGFICRVGDKTWLFSNIHVIAEVRQPTITRLDGMVVVPGIGDLAAGPDIARLALRETPPHPLEAMTEFDGNVRINDEVVVMGNSGGGGVVTSLKGKIVGIGPDRLEVSAEFIPGNSGSPIIHVKTGKVIGIATYLTRRYEEFTAWPQNGTQPANGATGTVVVRRFGYRLDKVPAWEPINWVELYREADQMEQISKLTADIFDFLNALREDKSPSFATDTLRRPAEEWLSRVRSSHSSLTDRRSATEGFLNALRFMVRGDVGNAEGRLRYTYFRNDLRTEQQIRDRLYKSFDNEQAKLSTPLNKAYR